jgi:hypothetical protein
VEAEAVVAGAAVTAAVVVVVAGEKAVTRLHLRSETFLAALSVTRIVCAQVSRNCWLTSQFATCASGIGVPAICEQPRRI